MHLREAHADDRFRWNSFVRDHFPPIGAFLQTWEWGDFQKALGRDIRRYFCFLNSNTSEPAGLFTLVFHSLPGGLMYGYMPRGPLFRRDCASDTARADSLLLEIGEWAKKEFPHLVFIRMEPPLPETALTSGTHLTFPPYYIQPRYNLAIALRGSIADMEASIHPSTRSNLRRAERRGVTVVEKKKLETADYDLFFAMAKDTIARNSGKNAYPSDSYFHSLFERLPIVGTKEATPTDLSLGIFYGLHNGEPAAAHFVLFFGKTATYLYGASHSAHLSSKVTTSLHWQAALRAKELGFSYYDLGGVDNERWPKLTTFKQQFRGELFRYIGNIDIPIRRMLYRGYSFIKGLRM